MWGPGHGGPRDAPVGPDSARPCLSLYIPLPGSAGIATWRSGMAQEQLYGFALPPRRSGGGGIEVRNLCNFFFNFANFRGVSQFPAIFPQFLFVCPPGVFVGALRPPCAEALPLEASGGSVTETPKKFPQFSCNFSQLDLTLPDHNPPPPRAQTFVTRGQGFVGCALCACRFL